jgi:hypothetical protein
VAAVALPFIVPVSVVVAGVEHAGTYDVELGTLTVYYAGDSMSVELGEASAKRRAEDVLRALVKRRGKR